MVEDIFFKSLSGDKMVVHTFSLTSSTLTGRVCGNEETFATLKGILHPPPPKKIYSCTVYEYDFHRQVLHILLKRKKINKKKSLLKCNFTGILLE